jgi:hypothetical protein
MVRLNMCDLLWLSGWWAWVRMRGASRGGTLLDGGETCQPPCVTNIDDVMCGHITSAARKRTARGHLGQRAANRLGR